MARTSNRREFLQLAHVYDPKKHGVNGWFASEKLDGMRAFWDGGITRGMLASEIPFANTTKDGIRISPPKSTGLWSRYGKPIQAPLWFLDELPPYPLDGELTTGRGGFQKTMSTVRKLDPIDREWEEVSYRVFDLPAYEDVFQDGRINVPQWTTVFAKVVDWLQQNRGLKSEQKGRRFETVVYLLNDRFPSTRSGIVKAIPQTRLPYNVVETNARIDELLTAVVDGGGEGLILRHYNSIWEPQRTQNCLKVKPYDDAEVIVRGYIAGRETDRGSKLLGKMGAMITEFNGKRLELSGFTDAERELVSIPFGGDTAEIVASNWCTYNPGREVPDNITSKHFPRGSRVTIRYRELTNDGLPKEARYFRPRPVE